MFCQHDFEIMDKTILPSAWEQMHTGEMGVKEVSSGTTQMFVKKVVFLLKCSICKQIKKIVEKNP